MKTQLYLPKDYAPLLDIKQTEHAITVIKDTFQMFLSAELFLRRVTAPLYVLKGTGINDDLNGTERPVTFPIKAMQDREVEIVHSLAKWKRMALVDYEIEPGFGVYTDMNALRPDEDLDNTHSVYVDQWDWEKHINPENRNLDYLKSVVTRLYEVIKKTEFVVYEKYPRITPLLPEHITFIHAEELCEMYPKLSPKEREDEITRQYGAVFVIGIGGVMPCGERHDGRAPDYDDWSTPTKKNFKGLNGDILLWNPVLKKAFEISSMGIRVNAESLITQLEEHDQTQRKELLFHKRLLAGELCDSIGGGIGQSRLTMFFLRKAHIGEIQASVWPEEMRKLCNEHNIILL
ncbi:aspartate--ammonia ligase [Chitinispirillales bacterium ANBcel5]|uniref:aspartate--ammonia ligase n=1 Tax=Cellulosispirillum alkaliphilum TaxID=3039283 RepID=UPI002A50077E|nr:aspartate--ammonia ligase [Chitinispirillales bacterium ANBcel5]